ncbi:hypothetical protein HAX54_003431, partial [Datura stramonium]|nr:hypothetical protein [Datura stramonium]
MDDLRALAMEKAQTFKNLRGPILDTRQNQHRRHLSYLDRYFFKLPDGNNSIIMLR